MGSPFPIRRRLPAYSRAQHPPGHGLSGSISLKSLPFSVSPVAAAALCGARCRRPPPSLCRHSGAPPAKPASAQPRLRVQNSAGISHAQSLPPL